MIEQYLMREFERCLAELRYELLRNLNDKRPLNLDSASRLVDVFNSRLVVFQHTFLRDVASCRGNVKQKIANLAIQLPRICEKVLPTVAGGAAAIGSWFAMTRWVVDYLSFPWNIFKWLWPGAQTSADSMWKWLGSWDIFKWFSSKPLTLAEKLGKWIGLPSIVAATGGTLLFAVAVFYLVRRLTAGWEDRRLYRSIIRQFDEIIAPELRNWARSVIRD
jgi:hypothetical protein